MAKDYAVTSVEQRMMPGGPTGFAERVIVRFSTPRGYNGSIELARADATPDGVKAAIEREVARVNAIYQL